jgi:hypothetical protein
MIDKLARLCSVGLVLLLAAGWLAFGQLTNLMAPNRSELEGETATAPASYHSVTAPEIITSNGTTACGPCHRTYPHAKNALSKSFLNLHSPRLDCMVCHLEKSKKRPSRLGWFEWSLAGAKQSSAENMKAFLAPYIDDAGGRETFESRSGKMTAGFSDKEKHVIYTIDPPCTACHSSGGISIFMDAGYDGDTAERLVKMEHITKFAEGKTFYYPRF